MDIKYLFLISILIATPAMATQYSPLFMPSEQMMDVVSSVNRRDDWYADNKITIKRLSEQPDHFRITVLGEGSYGSYQNVHWEKKAILKEDDYVKTLNSQMMIYDHAGQEVAVYRNAYDYVKNVATVVHTEKGKLVREETFSFKGFVCDDVSLVHFLKSYVAHADEKELPDFYLLSNEPKMYRVKVKKVKEETLNLASGKTEAIKLQLMADLGPLTELAATIIPATYVWYETKPPYRWLQYEGLDAGRHSENIVAQVTHRESLLFQPE